MIGWVGAEEMREREKRERFRNIKKGLRVLCHAKDGGIT